MALNNYQYGTSPRKIEPEYTPKRKKTTQKSKQKGKVKSKSVQQNRKNYKRKQNKKHYKNMALIAVVFAVLLFVSYRNSLINEKFNEIQNKKTELSSLEKTNEQLQVNIEGKTNLSNIGNAAKENLGMNKLNNDQKVYVTLDKKDYVESSISQEETKELNWFQKIINNIFGK